MDVIAGCALLLDSVKKVEVTVSLPRALLHALEARYTAEYSSTGEVRGRSMKVKDMKVACVIGLHPHERGERQRLEVDLGIRRNDRNAADRGRLDHKAIHDRLFNVRFSSASTPPIDVATKLRRLKDFEASSAGTLEALADQIAQKVLGHLPPDSTIDLTIRKPSALPFATPSITISRSSSLYDTPRPSPSMGTDGAGPSTAPRIFVALGSNIGDRFGHIRRAVRLLQGEGVRCVATGRMYESEPMYVEDQARFANTVIEVSTPSVIEVLLVIAD